MSFDINKKINDYVMQGYSEEHARSRVIQDVILHKIAHCNIKDNITVKGGW